jgi:inositol transporter-like SP family MFS transporter
MGMVAWALLSYAGSSLPVLLGFAVIWGVSAGIGAQAFYSVWTSELFATRYRATAQGVLFFAARCAVGGLSYVFPTLLTQKGVPFVGTIMLASLAVALVVGWRWAPDTQGKSLREIERERYGELVG